MKQKRTRFKTGAMRDTQDGKPNFLECISPFALWKYGLYMAGQAHKYPPDNWTKGIPPKSYLRSLERHLHQLKMDFKYGFDIEPGTDHASGVMFNIQGFMHERFLAGLTPCQRARARKQDKDFAELLAKSTIKKKTKKR